MHLNRRNFLAMSAAAAGASTFGLPALAQSAPGFKQFKLGALTLTALHDGGAERPLEEGFIRNAKLEDVKAFLTANGMAADKLQFNFSNLVIDDGKTKVMLDAGHGRQPRPDRRKLTENLKAAGIDPASISTILISHFHPDHISGLAAKEGLAKFDNAEIRVRRPNGPSSWTMRG